MLAFACAAVCTAGGRDAGRNAVSRRAALRLALAAAVAAAAPRRAAAAPQYGKPSTADLLHRMDRDRPAAEVAAERAARAEARRERLQRQRELAEAAEAGRREKGGATEGRGEDGVDIEANLRANYYYPTGRKRYLPRVKRACDELPAVTAAVREGRWPDVARCVEGGGSLDDLVLPMRLYASSLSGQGLSLAAKFVQRMGEDADAVQAELTSLRRAARKRDEAAALACLAGIGRAIASYRASGKLEADDFGVGEVPKDARVGSGLGNNNPALYNRNFSEVQRRPVS
jgi:hypothetical protein